MFGKNLKYYRLSNNMTMKELADKVGVTSMAISNYESDKRTPNISIFRKLAEILNVKLMDFMVVRNEDLQFKHGEFRKNTALAKTRQELIYESIEEYFNRFFVVVNILGSTVLPMAPRIHNLQLVDDSEISARKLREWLNLSVEGPVNSLITLLENNGVLIYLIDINDDKFSGLNGVVSGRPYITINRNMTPERQRFTIAHELVHMAFKWNDDIDLKTCERIANSIAGAFLLPAKDAVRELGIRRSGIKGDMIVPAKEFGISMICLAYRAKELEIITENAYRSFMIKVSQNGWRRNEPSRIEQESANLFKQLVYRAVEEEAINLQRGAELLNISYKQISEELSQFNDEE